MDPRTIIGRTFGERYRVSRQEGEDALGLRFVARDRETRKQARVLVLRPEIVVAHRDAIERSGRLSMQLGHPSAVTTLHQEITDETAVRITDWAPGGTLGGVLDEVPLMSSTVQWGLDIAQALAEAHGLGLVHEGIAPFTIDLVRRSEPPDRARLRDWGLRGLLVAGKDPLSSTGFMLTGGAAWLAPETIQQGVHDARSDLYALGAVLFHSLTGHPPYTGPELKVLAAHIDAPVPAPSQAISGVPHWLDELVLRLLAKDPVERPQSAEEVAGALIEGAALLRDGAAHPVRVTANAAPERLPRVALRGTAAHAPRVDRLSADPEPSGSPPVLPLVAGALLVGATLGLVALLLLL